MILTYRYRVKSLSGLLNYYSRSVNVVWNYCNDAQKHARKWGRRWPSAFDLHKLTSGSCEILGLNASTINHVCSRYAKSRQQAKRAYLRYRGKKSLGWVPVKGCDLKRSGDAFRYYGHTYRVFNSRQLPEGKIKDGTSFSQDARGNWYLNIVIEVIEIPTRDIKESVGVDLGLKDFAVLSTGEKIDNPRYYRELEQKLGMAQRANKKNLAKNIHAKIANRRRDALHKLSTRLTNEFDYIAIGNVNAKGLAKTKMAKSVLDAGWSTFRTMLQYKSIANGCTYEEVNESFSTQTCSACGCISGPKGRAGLNERIWSCSDCGATHDRDLNASINILRRGQSALVLGIAA